MQTVLNVVAMGDWQELGREAWLVLGAWGKTRVIIEHCFSCWWTGSVQPKWVFPTLCGHCFFHFENIPASAGVVWVMWCQKQLATASLVTRKWKSCRFIQSCLFAVLFPYVCLWIQSRYMQENNVQSYIKIMLFLSVLCSWQCVVFFFFFYLSRSSGVQMERFWFLSVTKLCHWCSCRIEFLQTSVWSNYWNYC